MGSGIRRATGSAQRGIIIISSLSLPKWVSVTYSHQSPNSRPLCNWVDPGQRSQCANMRVCELHGSVQSGIVYNEVCMMGTVCGRECTVRQACGLGVSVCEVQVGVPGVYEVQVVRRYGGCWSVRCVSVWESCGSGSCV